MIRYNGLVREREDMHRDKLNIIVAIGLGSLWAWSYFLFPSAGMRSPLLGVGIVSVLPEWHVSLLVGTIASVALMALRRIAEKSSACTLLALCGAAAQVMCGLVMLLSDATILHAVLAGIFSGIAIGMLWVCWFLALRRMDPDMMESGFVGALLFNVVCFLAAFAAPVLVKVVLFFALPFVQLGSFLFLFARTTDAEDTEEITRGDTSGIRESTDRAQVRRGLFCCVVAFAFIAFTGAWMAASNRVPPAYAGLLYASGMLIGVFVLALFIRFSPRIDIFESIRWIFPVIAIALAFGLSDVVVLYGVSVVLMALCHIAFEGMTRLGILSLARKCGLPFLQVAALGLAAISMGALLGVGLFEMFQSFHVEPDTLVVYALAVLVGLVLLLFNGHAATRPKPEPLRDEELCQVMSARFALSPRETEILSYLLAGRSSPYIRDELHIAKSTVDTHVRHIYEKTGVSSKQDLITLSERIGDPSHR